MTLWALAMIVGVLATYVPPDLFRGNPRLYGVDYETLHRHRIGFALDQIRSHGRIPAWYPREQLGSPFWSNIQNFPFVPTRLILLPLGPEHLFTAAMLLSASLAALFTFLYARSLGLVPSAAAVAGWTFAAAGFFASRLFIGHLHLLEAYPALPLLMWLVERCARRAADAHQALRWHVVLALGLACTCVALCGHPQLPMYSLIAAGAYALWRLRGAPRVVCIAAMCSGVGAAAFALLPMMMLVGRSTRVLPDIAKAVNDIALPYRRLFTSFFTPWSDGWPADLGRSAPHVPFTDYPGVWFFWDTVNYVGYAPWLALLGLAAIATRRLVLRRQTRTTHPATPFLIAMGIVAMALALPWFQSVTAQLPGTIVRAPCRLTYLVTFALALATGAAVHAAQRFMRTRSSRLRWTLLVAGATGLIAHGVNVVRHDREYVQSIRVFESLDGTGDKWLYDVVGDDGRAAIEGGLLFVGNRRVDDVGFFDSVVLAPTYEMLNAMTGVNERPYLENFSGSWLPARALAACGVRLTLGTDARRDAKMIALLGNVRGYRIADPAPRVAFVPPSRTIWLDRAVILKQLRSDGIDVSHLLLLRPDAPRPPASASSDDAQIAALAYERPTPDQFVINFERPDAGYVRILEARDTGWSASLDGVAAPIFPANEGVMAVPVPAGKHVLTLTFATPGARAGAITSIVCAIALCALSAAVRFRFNHPSLDPA